MQGRTVNTQGALKRAHAATRRLRAACMCALAAGAAWAVWPLDAPRPPRPAESEAPVLAAPEPAVSRLDLVAFEAPVFMLPADDLRVASAPPAPPPPPPPLKLQLLGIARGSTDDSGFVATLYDPDSDRVRRAVAGETLGAWRVEVVTADSVSLRQGNSNHQLAIRTDRPARGGAP
ncbi:hypothetical protein PHYC_00370 [Phycisphaerales bacterium]|nr:hypothetical protein PHYC_00370 [Phycisphaerales bacterium]